MQGFNKPTVIERDDTVQQRAEQAKLKELLESAQQAEQDSQASAQPSSSIAPHSQEFIDEYSEDNASNRDHEPDVWMDLNNPSVSDVSSFNIGSQDDLLFPKPKKQPDIGLGDDLLATHAEFENESEEETIHGSDREEDYWVEEDEIVTVESENEEEIEAPTPEWVGEPIEPELGELERKNSLSEVSSEEERDLIKDKRRIVQRYKNLPRRHRVVRFGDTTTIPSPANSLQDTQEEKQADVTVKPLKTDNQDYPLVSSLKRQEPLTTFDAAEAKAKLENRNEKVKTGLDTLKKDMEYYAKGLYRSIKHEVKDLQGKYKETARAEEKECADTRLELLTKIRAIYHGALKDLDIESLHYAVERFLKKDLTVEDKVQLKQYLKLLKTKSEGLEHEDDKFIRLLIALLATYHPSVQQGSKKTVRFKTAERLEAEKIQGIIQRREQTESIIASEQPVQSVVEAPNPVVIDTEYVGLSEMEARAKASVAERNAEKGKQASTWGDHTPVEMVEDDSDSDDEWKKIKSDLALLIEEGKKGLNAKFALDEKENPEYENNNVDPNKIKWSKQDLNEQIHQIEGHAGNIENLGEGLDASRDTQEAHEIDARSLSGDEQPTIVEPMKNAQETIQSTIEAPVEETERSVSPIKGMDAPRPKAHIRSRNSSYDASAEGDESSLNSAVGQEEIQARTEKTRRRRRKHRSSASYYSSQPEVSLREEALPEDRDGEKNNRFAGLLKSLIGGDKPVKIEEAHEHRDKHNSEQSQSSGRRRRKKSSSRHSHRSRRTHTSSCANNPIEDWVNKIEFTDQEYHSDRANDTDRGQDGSDFYFTDESDVEPIEKVHTHSRTRREQSVKPRQHSERKNVDERDRRDSGYGSGPHFSETLASENAMDSASSMTPPDWVVRKGLKEVEQRYDRGLASHQAYASDEETVRLEKKSRSHRRSSKHQERHEHHRAYDSKTVISNNPISFFGTRSTKPRTHSVVSHQTMTSTQTRSSTSSRSKIRTRSDVVPLVVRMRDLRNGERQFESNILIGRKLIPIDASERPALTQKTAKEKNIPMAPTVQWDVKKQEYMQKGNHYYVEVNKACDGRKYTVRVHQQIGSNGKITDIDLHTPLPNVVIQAMGLYEPNREVFATYKPLHYYTKLKPEYLDATVQGDTKSECTMGFSTASHASGWRRP